MIILYVVLAVVILLVMVSTANRARERRLQESGLIPPPGQGTSADIERLVTLGRKIDAIKLYRAIHKTDLTTAKQAIDRLSERPDLHVGAPPAM